MIAAAAPRLLVRLPAVRARIVLGVFFLAFLLLLGRAVYLQGVNKDFLRQKGEARFSRVITLKAHRGNILDRHGEPLAISTPVESVAASPKDVELDSDKATRLARLLGLSVQELERKLRDERDFVYLRRQLSPSQAEKVIALDVPGIFLLREYRRYYPYGEQTAHLIGFTDIDDRGQEGVELAFEKLLAGRDGSRRVLKDRLGNIVEGVESIRAPQDGQAITLAIDRNIQYLAYRELAAAVAQHRAKAGAAVVLDARTGEVLALVNQPSYNPNRRVRGVPLSYLRNRVVTDIFEPGSTLKPFTIAAALEAGRVTPQTVIATAGGMLTIGKTAIHDVHVAGDLTVTQVIQKSSNVGAARIALMLPSEYLHDRFARLGFGRVPGMGFPGEAAGKLRPAASWRPIEQATMAYGHGISVSLIQLARAYTVFAQDGLLRTLSLLRVDAPAPATRVFSAETARAVRDMLETVVQPGGTAPRAQVLGYRVAGKTGTAHKLDGNGGYAENRYVASFVGFAPASDPRLVVAVMIDEPTNGQSYGGQVAAPVFAQIMAGALRWLAVPPDAPGQMPAPLPGGAEIGEST